MCMQGNVDASIVNGGARQLLRLLRLAVLLLHQCSARMWPHTAYCA